MDDFIDQMLLSTPHWAEPSNIASSMDRAWDINIASIIDKSTWDIAAVNHGSMLIDSIQDVPKLPTVPLVQFVNAGSLDSQGLVAVGNNDGGSSQAAAPYRYSAGQRSSSSSSSTYDTEFQDSLLLSMNVEAEHSTPHCISFPPRTLSACITPSPIGSTSASGQSLHLGGATRGSGRLAGVMEACEFQSPSLTSSSSLVAPMWHQAYMGRGMSGGFCQQDVRPIETNLGKRSWDNGDTLTATTQAVVASQPGQMNLTSSVHENQSSGSPVGNGTAKPRARARRGQATDPHSIAERNRRERIAERMKALQELVPDANKTDKASMLDEIIAYIKFLQMQVKCLSVCRLGSAGTAASLISDLTDKLQGMNNFTEASLGQSSGVMGSMQDGLCFVESQVASLMDKDMSAAMQYLQSKGLCLMPISLASAISKTAPMQQCGPFASPRVMEEEEDGIEKQLIEASSSLPCNNGRHYTIRPEGTCGKSTAEAAPSPETCTKPAGNLNQDTER